MVDTRPPAVNTWIENLRMEGKFRTVHSRTAPAT